MLVLLSPAKSLDFESSLPQSPKATQPQLLHASKKVVKALQALTTPQLASLMGISDKLAMLNIARHLAWQPIASPQNSRPAVLAFDGDVYTGLRAKQLTAAQLEWAQNHIAILSGLYGLLRPLDALQPYRLEMGSPLVVGAATNLYAFWQKPLGDHLLQTVQAAGHKALINLASQEYFKAVDTKRLDVPVVECAFTDEKAGQTKIISFFAKKARGLMARHIIEHRITDPYELTSFHSEGYRYQRSLSTESRLVFHRTEKAAQPYRVTAS